MMDTVLQQKLELACRIAKSCFDRGMGSGMTGNLSFMHDGVIYITASGTCFGFLTPDDFAAVPYEADDAAGSDEVNSAGPAVVVTKKTAPTCTASLKKPSKELPLHKIVYDRLRRDGHLEGAVIHTHATYSVLWSCVPGLDPADCVPDHTPYLRMKMGACGLVPYEKPGSEQLFDAFRQSCGEHYGWLLAHHGLVTGGKSLLEAFGRSEELEESCKIAWMLRNAGL